MARQSVGKKEVADAAESETRNTSGSTFADLQKDVARIYDEGISMAEAERMAAKFLAAQMTISEELKAADLSARMKKNGRKTMEATVLLAEIAKHEKKPTESVLNATVQTHLEVAASQNAEDRAATDAEAIRRLYDMLKDAHIFCRGVSRGTMG